jgi:hypothetical protein
MRNTAAKTINDMDFAYENSVIRVIANRNSPEIKLGGITLDPFEEGNEYEVRNWVANELEQFGIAHRREDDRLDSAKLYKIQWKERAQTAGQIIKPSENFYPELRRYIKELKEESKYSPEKMREYERAMQLTQDIVNSRLKKIIMLATTLNQTDQVLRNFTNEEKFLYDQLTKLIHSWRSKITHISEDTQE